MQFIAPCTTFPEKKTPRLKPPDKLATPPDTKDEPRTRLKTDNIENSTDIHEQHTNTNGWHLHVAVKRFLENSCLRTNSSETNTSSNTAQVHFKAENNSMDIKHLESSLEYTELLYKVLIIGDSGVGKTSMVQRYAHGKSPTNYKMTLGVDFALKVVKWSDSVSVKLQLWDIAGQERFTCMTRVYYKDAHACIIMFDLTQRQTFLNALKWKQDLDTKCTLPDGSPIPCILLANKCDLKQREVEQSEIEAFCKEQEFIGWTEVSVKEGLMIEEAMKFLLEEMMQRYNENTLSQNGADCNQSLHQSTTGASTVKLSQNSQQENSKCKC